MGSHNFALVWPGSDLRAAYDQACSEADAEYGQRVSNGSISTTAGVTLDTATPMAEEEARRRASRRIDHYQKRGPAGAIPLLAERAIRRRTITMTVTVPGDPDWEQRLTVIDQLVAARVRLRDGERVLGWTEQQAPYEPDQPRPTGGPAPSFRYATAATRGTTETRYMVLNERGEAVGDRQRPEWERGLATQAAARRFADACARQVGPMAQAGARFVVEGRTRRVGGEPLVTATRELVGTKLPLVVTVGKQRSQEVGGFLFFGWVAS
jgi:hypothetical protein